MTSHPYAGATMIVATRHGKRDLASPAFAAHLGATLRTPPDIDTDQFGTFTLDIPRTLTPHDAALAKARLGTHITGTPYALASEATYATLGMFSTHHELLLFHDSSRNITITEHTRISVRSHSATVTTPEEALAAANQFGFPTTFAVLSTPKGISLHKGICDPNELREIAADMLTTAQPITVQPDYRAHANPARQHVIRALADTLARRLASTCPRCDTPGWGISDVKRGLPCGQCGNPTQEVSADILGCVTCPYQQTTPRPARHSDPEWCDHCNP